MIRSVMLDIQVTQGSYWKGAQIPYYMFIILTIFGGLFGLDHLALRSPLTAILKVLSIIPLLGFWYFYDIAQAIGEREYVEKYGIAVPFYGPIGIGAGILSALTESIIYFMVKDNPISVSPFIQLLKTYLLGGIVSVIYLLQFSINHTTTSLDYHYWITLILFNAIIGFLGYLLRFIMISKLSTLLFNSLIFTGVIFSYIWGYILSNEPITYSNLSGTVLILMSIFLINKK